MCYNTRIMRLYHGSNVVVKEPKILESSRRTDFGVAFYLTTSLEQAKRWAKLRAERTGEGLPVVSVFELEGRIFKSLKLRKFLSANAAWLKYVAEHRLGTAKAETADIVVGPVADDKTLPTLTRYLLGVYTQAETLRRLKTQKLLDQYAFRTEKALAGLRFVEEVRA